MDVPPRKEHSAASNFTSPMPIASFLKSIVPSHATAEQRQRAHDGAGQAPRKTLQRRFLPHQGGVNRAGHESRHAAAQAEAVRDDVVIEIDQAGGGQAADHDRVDERRHRVGRPVLQPDRHEKERHADFHQPVAHIDARAAAGGPAPQHQPTDDRQIVVPGNRRAAGGAVRAGADDRAVQRNAVNADVEKGADAGAHHKGKNAFENMM